jgi:hypothetical protein
MLLSPPSYTYQKRGRSKQREAGETDRGWGDKGSEERQMKGEMEGKGDRGSGKTEEGKGGGDRESDREWAGETEGGRD